MLYNSSLFSPPCPAIEVELQNPVLNATTIQTIAQIDTGADYCAIPITIVSQLNLMPYRHNNFNNHDGTQSLQEVFRIKVSITHLPVLNLDAIYLPFLDRETYIILGREALNTWLMLLDGPAQEFTVDV
jgi:predicted aspartyl protease